MSFIKKNARNFLEKTGFKLIGASKKIYITHREKTVKKWIKDSGDEILRTNYDLDENSIVFDVGGYKGQWASDIYSKYNSIIHIFEPVKTFYNNIEDRFKKNKTIIVHNFGLSNKDQIAHISLDNDASSAHVKDINILKNKEKIELKDIYKFITQNKINSIDLMKINIEGGEYNLLERLIETSLLSHIKNIQIQFHDFVPNAKSKTKKIQEELSKTHKITYNYPFVWENWRLK